MIDNWQPHGSEVNQVAIAPGRHELRVEYYQVDGWVELRVEIVRGLSAGETVVRTGHEKLRPDQPQAVAPVALAAGG